MNANHRHGHTNGIFFISYALAHNSRCTISMRILPQDENTCTTCILLIVYYLLIMYNTWYRYKVYKCYFLQKLIFDGMRESLKKVMFQVFYRRRKYIDTDPKCLPCYFSCKTYEELSCIRMIDGVAEKYTMIEIPFLTILKKNDFINNKVFYKSAILYRLMKINFLLIYC